MLTNNNDITLFYIFLFLKYLINSRPITIPSSINIININTAGKSLRNVHLLQTATFYQDVHL